MKRIRAAAGAGLAAASLAGGLAVFAPQQAALANCTITAHAVTQRGNAGHITVTVTADSCSSWHARVRCHANTGGTTNWRNGGDKPGPGSSTAGCYNGSYPDHGGYVRNDTGTYVSFY